MRCQPVRQGCLAQGGHGPSRVGCDRGEYLAYLREFLFGDLGDLTYDVARWTPSLALGAGYTASAAGLAEPLARRGGRRPARARRSSRSPARPPTGSRC